MSIIVTGGAGFIGSCVVRALNDLGEENIIVVDNILSTEKWKNLRNKRYIEYVNRDDFLERLDMINNVEAVIHLGACSSTTEADFDYLWRNNVEYSKALWQWCIKQNAQFIYASSAATYGDGSNGFDDRVDIDSLLPLNGYGYSKQAFDQWARRQEDAPPQHVGLKFFNVYGPNEYFKGPMASMAFHGFKQIISDGEIRLFKSGDPAYDDGGQLRDFVYVKDVVKVIIWLLDRPHVSGLFNVGTGRAQSFRELAEGVFHALDLNENIRYIDMPEYLKEKYQYYTQADLSKLREAGYKDEFRPVQEGILDYVQCFLNQKFKIW